jgi:hypothetical protein
VGDIEADLPTGASVFLVAQGEPPGTVRHVLEKTYIPLPVFLDADANVGGTLYRQPRTGLPFGRSYVVDADGFVTDVFTSYRPLDILDSINDAL